MIDQWDADDEARRVGGRARTVGEFLAIERPLLRPLPAEPFETGLWLTKTINRYGRVDLLCVDELGYMELDRRGAELLFQVLTEREEKASVAIASSPSAAGPRPSPTPGTAMPRTCIDPADAIELAETLQLTPAGSPPTPST